MINTKSNIQGLLAVAALAMVDLNIPMRTASTVSPKNRHRHEEDLARKKRLAESGLTADQRQWNEVIDAKRAAKKEK